MASLVSKILATERLQFVSPAAEGHFRRLKKLMRTFVENFEVVRPVVREILNYVVLQQVTRYRGVKWDGHWKEVSCGGYDLDRSRNWKIDYENIEYTMLLSLFTDVDDGCRVAIEELAVHFESLHPNATLTPNAVEKQGDVIEIVMAALRGHRFFRPIFATMTDIGGRSIPELFVVFCDLCKAIQYLDAFLKSGWCKHKREYVPELLNRIPGMTSDVNCSIWHCTPNIGWGLFPMGIQFGPIVACPLS